MKVLFLTPRPAYPPTKGDTIRSYAILDALTSRHAVWCGSFVEGEISPEVVEGLRAKCRDVALVPLNRRAAMLRGMMSWMSGGTVMQGFYDSRGRALRALLERWCEEINFDAVFAFSSAMAPFALAVPARRSVLDLCDLDSAKWQLYAAHSRWPMSVVYGYEGQRLALKECRWIEQFDAVSLISEVEGKDLPAHLAARITVIRNGVDVPSMENGGESSIGGLAARSLIERVECFFDAEPELAEVTGHRFQTGATLCEIPLHRRDAGATLEMSSGVIVGFVGTMDYWPNVDGACWFVEEVWPRVRQQVPHAEFRIVGRDPTRRVRALGRASGVMVVGAVEDVGTELRGFDVSVAPLRMARGVQNKVLEAMAYGCAVVLTPDAALGIDGRDGEHYAVRSEAHGFAEAVVKLLTEPSERHHLASAARDWVAARFSWDAEKAKVLDFVAGTCVAHRA